jgi:RNA 2',3'-cyclic 3'-phosphodiesterase
MHRLFVALRPTQQQRDRLLGIMGSDPTLRWQHEDRLHLTLRFVGEVDGRQADDLALALGSISGPQPSIGFSGLGSFGNPPTSIWAAVVRDQALLQLQARIERAVQRAGLPPERRAFTPHVTLARLSRRTLLRPEVIAAMAGLSIPAAQADHFILYESSLGRAGANYHPIARFMLAPSAD